MSKKRTLDGFFEKKVTPKKARIEASPQDQAETDQPVSFHPTYPHPVPHFPSYISNTILAEVPASEGRHINDQPDLDLLYFQPFIPKSIENDAFQFLRKELFFYRVKYKIKRGPVETDINTPRFTTVFGVDETSKFDIDGKLVDSKSEKPIPMDRYRTCSPRPIPGCLEQLRQLAEVFTGSTYNFCLVNYYANGADSISYHSDDERFLGPEPAIASFSLGARRDFLMKHKPAVANKGASSAVTEDKASKPLKFPLASGDMVLMRGKTQSNWLHSIPKRKGGEAENGRINITFRKAMVPGGTANYYQYNVGSGEVHRWDAKTQQMLHYVENSKSNTEG